MDILVEITDSFDKDLKHFSPSEKNKIKQKLNDLISKARETKNLRHLYRLHKVPLQNNLSSSLFIFKIDLQLRAILTFENDPLFNQSILTLYRVIRHRDLDKTFKSVSESLYQNMFNSKTKKDGRN
jgi:mRNA-degrading endonuclease YafQ of YafQ-DinJ toxin-antitoxin module